MTHENLQFWAWQVTEQGCKTHTPPPPHKKDREREKKDEKRNEKSMLVCT
jgi:hypothetical protein